MSFLFRTRSLVALLTALVLTVGSVIATAILYQAQSYERDRIRQAIDTQLQVSQVFSILQDAETGQRGYLLTGRDDYLAPFMQASASLRSALGQLQARLSASEQGSFQDLRGVSEEKLAELGKTIELKRAGRDAESLAIVLSNHGKNLMDRARAIAARMQHDEDDSLDQFEKAASRNRLLTQAGIGISLILTIALGFFAVVDSQRQYRALARANDEVTRAHGKLLEEVRRRELAEDTLRQAQKMEAIGQLTGGLAHDFNNMLAVIIGSLNLLKRRISRGEKDVERFVDSALEGASRAANLTHRLLAFARQQPLAPSAIDVNKFVQAISEIIRRTLGENIQVETVLAGGLWRTYVDSAQLESAILNLAVNSRDAMPEGGKLTIETANASLDEVYAARHAEVPAGQYVLITVTDTGQGMTPEVIERAFDPYFTTKGVGKGTGLGLSQVMGFVKQSAGHIKIYSEPGHGTAVKIYLPRFFGEAEEIAESARPVAADAIVPDHMILVVEDEDRMRTFIDDAFRELGYRVLSAPNAATALQLLDANPQIGLLFTDVVMPDMNGRRLAEEALRRRPQLKVIYTTGFSRNAVIHNGVLDKDVNFIAKPFTLDQLAAKVKEVLGNGASSGQAK